MANTEHPKLKQAFWTPHRVTQSKTLTGTDSGIAWHNRGATGPITMTLPLAYTPAGAGVNTNSGLSFQFLVAVAQTITIQPLATDTIRGLAMGAALVLPATLGTFVQLEAITPSFWEVSTFNSVGGVTSVTGTTNEIVATPTTGAVVLSFAPNVVIPAPASGVALTINGTTGSGAIGLEVNAGSASTDRAILIQNATASVAFLDIRGNGQGFLGPNIGVTGLQWAASGAMTVLAPSSSGTALTVNGAAASKNLLIEPGDSASVAVSIVDPGTNAAELRLNTTNTDVSIQTTSSGTVPTLSFKAGAHVALQISNTGTVTVPAPVSGDALTVTNVAGANAIVVVGNSAGTAVLRLNTQATTGTKTAAMTATNKPGTNNQTTPAVWLPVNCDGTIYYFPGYAA